MKLNIHLKTFLNRTLVIFIVLIFCFSLLEIGLRVIGRVPTEMMEGIVEQWGSSFRLKNNLKKTIRYPSFSYEVNTNSFGFRDKTTGEKNLDNKPYYIFLGASDVFANGVNYEDSFVGILGEFASKKGIEVLNLAIGGHFFLDQELLFKDFLKKVIRKPEKLFFCVNALHIPKFDKKNENIVVRSGHLFEKKNWKPSYLRIMIGNVSSAYCFFRDNIRKFQARKGNVKGEDNNSEFLNIYFKQNRMHDPETIKQFENYLKGFEKYCHEEGITPIYVYLPLADSFRLKELLMKLGKNPEEYDTSYYEELMVAYCKNQGVKLINLGPILKMYYEKGIKLRFDLDSHFNKFTNRVIGEYLIEEMFSKKMD